MSLLWSPAHLAVFARVVDLNGFSSAARALGVPKAAVSRAVAELERQLGLRVLERTTRRISLTAAGKLIYPHARRLLDEAEAARAIALRCAGPAAGTLRVIADPTYGRVLLAPLVPRFLESFPEVTLDVTLHEGSAERWDVAIHAGESQDPTLDQRLLGTPPAVLCATPAYLQLRGQPKKPDDLRGHDLLAPESDGPEVRLELTHGNQRAEVRLRPKLAVNDPAVLHASAAAGLGIGLLPEFLCRQGLATGRLKRVLEEWSVPPISSLYARYPRELAGDPRVERFVEFLAANIVPALAAEPAPGTRRRGLERVG